jgi:hypothetical protein
MFQDEEMPELRDKQNIRNAPDVPTRTFFWAARATVGDCEMAEGATIVFRADGWGFFDARVRSSDSGDIFRVGFTVLEGSTVIATLPQSGVGTYQRRCPDNHTFADMHVDFQLSPIYFDRITGVRRWFYDCSG